MFQSIGLPGMLLIFMLALIIFGPQKLPQLGRAVGQTFREFRKTVNEVTRDSAEEAELTEQAEVVREEAKSDRIIELKSKGGKHDLYQE